MVRRKQVELLVVVAAYFGVYVAVVGPAIGSVTGFDTSVWTGSTDRGATIVRVLTTPRGWLLLLGFFPVVFGYVVLRARLAGAGVAEFWNE